MRKPVTAKTANKIWDILIEYAGRYDYMHGETDYDRLAFVTLATEGRWTQFRFQGSLGFGGKVYYGGPGFVVTCYREDETPDRVAAMATTNAALEQLFEDAYGDA